jgi:hypothetical protein
LISSTIAASFDTDSLSFGLSFFLKPSQRRQHAVGNDCRGGRPMAELRRWPTAGAKHHTNSRKESDLGH